MNRMITRAPRVRAALVAVLAAALLALVPLQPTPPAHAQAGSGVLGPSGQRGIAFVHTPSAPFGSQASFDSLKRLHDTGANWVTIVTPFRQANAHATSFYRGANDPTDDGIVQIALYAHSLGMRVMVQPVVLSDDGIWNGWFAPDDTDLWFKNYSDMLKTFGHVAQTARADEFCVGTEFFTLTQRQYSPKWREVVSALKFQYFGPLTYSANWGDKKNPEFNTIDWWDALDYIGISAYFPLSWNNFLTDPLRAGWFAYADPFGPGTHGQEYHWFNLISDAHGRWNKPVQFTKIGFASYANSPGRWDLRPDPYLELSVQANAYDATMQAWGNVSWMTGIFWTPWYSNPNAGGSLDIGESPQNKPAEQILHKWYTGQR
jgi:hypothetical protein